MARQVGLLKLRGTIDDLTFYLGRQGYFVRKKSNLTGLRIATDPVFERTRDNMAEFKTAMMAGKTLRRVLGGLLNTVADKKMPNRLAKMMMQVVKSDGTNQRGSRTVQHGNLRLLEGFEFNERSKLGSIFFPRYIAIIDRAAGQMRTDIPGFIPAYMIRSMRGASYFRINSVALEVDFDKEHCNVNIQQSPMLELDASVTNPISLVHAVKPCSTKPLLLAVGIEFYERVGGKYVLKTLAKNAMAIIKAGY